MRHKRSELSDAYRAAAADPDFMRQMRALAPSGQLLTHRQAARYLSISPRALQDRADIPRLDVSAPGATRRMWRYRREDLDEFILSRVKFTRGSGNVYADLGFPDAEERLAKANARIAQMRAKRRK